MSSAKLFKSLLSKLKVPVISAPMVGGSNNPIFVSEVIKNGGIGSFGFGHSSVLEIENSLTDVLANTNNGPINANFFIYPPQNVLEAHMTQVPKAMRCLKSIAFVERNSIPLTVPKEPFYHNLDDCLEPVWKLSPKLLTFHFGLPSANIINMAKSKNILVGVTATTVDEAMQIKQAGADFVVAQGREAGGQRGSFIFQPQQQHNSDDSNLSNTISCNESDMLSTVELVRQIHSHVGCELPVVAAGGIMTGRDIHTVLSAGAVAVQMGTAFLACHECSPSPEHKQFLLTKRDRQTVFRNVFAGRPARSMVNEFIEQMTNTTANNNYSSSNNNNNNSNSSSNKQQQQQQQQQ